ncbi:MAG: mitochondrial fission ELM1 family protein [Pseudomonadota bacterium]
MSGVADLSQATCWVVSEGIAGLQGQGVGLAQALGIRQWTQFRMAKPGLPWKLLPSAWWPARLPVTEEGAALLPPWPDLLITCGRVSVATALHVRRASGGRTFTVHIQDPFMDTSHFDVVLAPAHDRVRGDNVLSTRGALHRIDATVLAAAAARTAPRFAHLPSPRVAVLVGGSNKRQRFTTDVMRDFAGRLAAAAQASGATLLVTTSRRTGAENERILREALAGVPAWIWDGQGDNPYPGLLALADAIVVTCDSVSMTSEACSSGRPVHVYEFPGGSARFRHFHADLMQAGITRAFGNRFERWHCEPLDETRRAAEFVRARYAARNA